MRIRRCTRRWARRSITYTDWRSMRSAAQEADACGALTRACEWWDLGRVGYGEAFGIQHGLVEQRKRGEIADQFLIVEHPHTNTLGRNGNIENLLAQQDVLA